MSKDHRKQSSSSTSGRKKSGHSALNHLIVGNRRKTKHSRQVQHKKEIKDASKGISATANLMPTHVDNIQDSLVKATNDDDTVVEPAASTATQNNQDKGIDMSSHSNEKKGRVHKAKSSTAAAAVSKKETTEKAQRRVSHCDETPAKKDASHQKNVEASMDVVATSDECGGTCSQAVRSQQEIERLRDCMNQLRQDLQSELDTKTALHQQIAVLREQVKMEEKSKQNRFEARVKDMDTIHQQNVENNGLNETINQLKKQQQNDKDTIRLQNQAIEKLKKQAKSDEAIINELHENIDQLHKQQNNDKERIDNLNLEIDQRKKQGKQDRKRWQDSIQSINQLEANCTELETRRNEFVHYITQISSLTNNLDATRERQDFRPLPSTASTYSEQWKLFHEPSIFHDDCDTVGASHRLVASVASTKPSTASNNAGNSATINNESSSAVHFKHEGDSSDMDDDYADTQNVSLAPTQTEPLKHDQLHEDVGMIQQNYLRASMPKDISDAPGPKHKLPKVAISDEQSSLATPLNADEDAIASPECHSIIAETAPGVATTPEPSRSQAMETEKNLEETSTKDSTLSIPHGIVKPNALGDDEDVLSPTKSTQVVPSDADDIQGEGGDNDETQLPSEYPIGAMDSKNSTTPEDLPEETLCHTSEIDHNQKEQDSIESEEASVKQSSTKMSIIDTDQEKPAETCEQRIIMEMSESTTPSDRCEVASQKEESTAGDNVNKPKEVGSAALSPTTNVSDRSNSLSPKDKSKKTTLLPAEDDSVLWDDDEAGSKSSKTSHQTTLSNWQKPTTAIPKESKESTEGGWMTTRKPTAPTKKQTLLASFVTPKEKSRVSGRSKKKQQKGSTSFSSSFTKSAAKKRKNSMSPTNINSDAQEQKRSRLSMSSNFDDNITDSQDSFNAPPNRVSLSASKAPVPSRFLDTPNHRDLELDSKSNKSDDGNLSSVFQTKAKRKVGHSQGMHEDPVTTASYQEPSYLKPVQSSAAVDKDGDDESQASETRVNLHPNLGLEFAATQAPKNLGIKEVLVRHDSLPAETQLTTHGDFDGVLNSPATKHRTQGSEMNLSQGSETQWDMSSPIIDNTHTAVNTTTQQHKEKENQISEGSATQWKTLDSTGDDGRSDKVVPTKPLETQLSEGSETQWEKPQSTVSNLGLKGSMMQKNDELLSQGSETQWEKPESFVAQNDTDESFSVAKAQPARREAQSQVRFALPNDKDDSELVDSSKSRASRVGEVGESLNTSPSMNADTQGSETQYDDSALLDANTAINLKDTAGAAADSENLNPAGKAKKGEGESAQKTKMKKAFYNGTWISNTHDRNFVDEMDNGRRRSAGKENNNYDADFMEQAPHHGKQNYARPSYVEPKRRKTNCNDCRSCAKCRDYYRVLERQGIDTDDPAFLQQNAVKNSRHTIYTPGISSQETPADFWELSFIDSQKKRAEKALQEVYEEEDNDNGGVADFEAEDVADSWSLE